MRRSTLLLGDALVALWGALGIFVAVGPITADDLSGRESAGILMVGAYSVAQRWPPA